MLMVSEASLLLEGHISLKPESREKLLNENLSLLTHKHFHLHINQGYK